MTRWQPTHCPVCRRLLLHRAGAAIILCPSCHSLLHLHAHPSTPGQTVCFNCTNIIRHPIGPYLLQCRTCAAVNSAPVLNYMCRVCSLYLTYSSTLPAVVCPVCHTVEPPIDNQVSPIPLLLPLNHDAPPRPCPSLPPRHIPWLPSTPVRPVTSPRPAQPRAPQQLFIQVAPHSLEVPAPPHSSSPATTPSLPELHASVPMLPLHNTPSQSEPTSHISQQLQTNKSHPGPTFPHTAISPDQPQPVPLNWGKASINGENHNGDKNEDVAQHTPDSSNLPESSSVSSKNVKQEEVTDTND